MKLNTLVWGTYVRRWIKFENLEYLWQNYGKVQKYFEKRIVKPFQPVEELKQLNAK